MNCFDEDKIYKYVGISKKECEEMGIYLSFIENNKLYVKVSEKGKSFLELLKFNTDIEIIILNEEATLSVNKKEMKKYVSDILEENGCSTPSYEVLMEKEDEGVGAFVDYLINTALEMVVSDIHFEIFETILQVRFRKKGRLYVFDTYPNEIHPFVLTRIKILSKMDISQRRLPQDGRFSHFYNGRDIDIRTSTSPTLFGEKIVLRLLDVFKMEYSIKNIVSQESQRKIFQDLLLQASGLILFTGPTNSGKSTSIYAMLNELNTNSRNIMTIEDPVEYKINGINQMQVNEKAGMDFTQGLRTMLRQDPDVLMVGEIRNSETAKIAIRAAITGHLVFSTIHTRDSVSAIYRLMDMGIEPYLISESVIAIISQRLVNCLCPHCKRKLTKKDTFFAEKSFLTYEPVGCEKCDNGYLERKAIFEIVVFDDEIRKSIYERESLDKIYNILYAKKVELLKKQLSNLLETGEISLSEAYRSINTL